MTIQQFQANMKDYSIFSLRELNNVCNNFSYKQLQRWQKKGYLKHLVRNYYWLGDDQPFTSYTVSYIANKIYSPSYVSLETALKFYNLIPEEVFQITSVSTRKTSRFQTDVGYFIYRQINPSLFWGYDLVHFQNLTILIAQPEKALADFLYLKTYYKTEEDFQSLRFNEDMFFEIINVSKFRLYCDQYKNKSLDLRLHTLIKTIENARSQHNYRPIS